MVKKIIACSDIHVRNVKRMDETGEMLSLFIDKCKEITSKYSKDEVRIVVAGDIFHQKIDISNEANVIVSWFLRELSSVAKTIVIAGNHDFLMNNKNRVDSLTPVFSMCEYDNCVYLDMALGYISDCYVDDNIVWSLYSSFDDFCRPNIEESKMNHEGSTYVGLIHADINGATTDTGRATENSIPPTQFSDLDFVIAGHIHKRQEIKKGGVKIVYCGSLIQQDNGENINGHGYVVWDVEKKTYKAYDLPNENYGYFKFKINDIEDIENNKEELINI